MSEDRIHRRIQKLQLFLESMQEELQYLTEDLNEVTITRGRNVSSLTKQFNMLSSPSESPNPRNQKRISRKDTPEFRRVYEVNDDNRTDTPEHMRVPAAQIDQRRRIQPTLVPKDNVKGNLELHRSYTMGGDNNWKEKEEAWKKRRQETLANKQPLESLGMKTYREVTTDDEETDDESEELFLPSFGFKSKGNSKENTKQWILRMNKDAIQKNINPLRSKTALDLVLTKLGRVQKGFNATEKEIRDANSNFTSLKSLFQRIVKFIQSKKKSALKM